jgi:penicillin-binding protein 2
MSKTIIKDNFNEKKIFQKRFFFLIGIIVLIFIILFGNLIKLQIIDHKQYVTQSINNVLNIIPHAPNRGLIYDRNGTILAENIPAYQIMVTPADTPNIKQSVYDLQKIIQIPDATVQSFFKSLYLYRSNQAVPLLDKLTAAQVAIFYINQYKFPGMDIQAHMIRHYPEGEYFANIIGYVGRINIGDIKNIDKENYSGTNFIGKTGIENQYESILHGQVGVDEIETNAKGSVVKFLQQVPPISGSDLTLSIDSKLQIAAYDALGDNQGAVVVINPNNGEILALVTKPSFDPNLFVTGISNTEYNDLTNSPTHPLFDRAIRGQFSPGSTIKPFYALEALDHNLITTATKVYDPGWFKLPNSTHIYHDWKRGGHGWVNVVQAIAVSCDTFFYNLAVNNGIDHMDQNLYDFGFGSPTQVDMPDELSGLVPTPEWKKKHIGANWYTGDTVVAGIGQGYLTTTPLQLAYATSILANRGIGYKPHLLTTIGGKSQHQTNILPIITTNLKLKNNNNWDVVMDGMQQVITSPLGTGGTTFGRNPKYTIAAKTGTAQVYGKKRDEEDQEDQSEANIPKQLRNNHLFIAYAPVTNPKIAIAVVTEHNSAAATTARKVLDEYLIEENHA